MDALLITVISVLLAAILSAIGYFLKKIFEKTEIISADVSDIKPKVDIMWKDKYAPALSPRQLNDRGQTILNDSGIREIIESKKQKLFEQVRLLNPLNAYDAEQAVF